MLPHGSKYTGNLTCFNTLSNRNISRVLNILNTFSSDLFFLIAHITLSFFSYVGNMYLYITTNVSLRKVMPFKTEVLSLKTVSDFTTKYVFKTDFSGTCLSRVYCRLYIPVVYTKVHCLNPRKSKFWPAMQYFLKNMKTVKLQVLNKTDAGLDINH